ncbi:hypothetical protein [Legionella worsleiensis]|uniref:Uncharacterized protein n=1 Tax=Legionella worsleiensis TaxID=45076 RepID=A0A0W1AH66_9GAMM|nr:hypothetical protein [Legionella worsleiensis]KTD80714.1 hypothetical protein Lwor_0957 [Legionella worsleiensis]STY32708.1 Uncharacterised protein [Legionella worsleiensis]
MFYPQQTIKYTGPGVSPVYLVEFSFNSCNSKMTINFIADQKEGITNSLLNANIPFTEEGTNTISIQNSFQKPNIRNSLCVLANDGFISHDFLQEIKEKCSPVHRNEVDLDDFAYEKNQQLQLQVLSRVKTFFKEKRSLQTIEKDPYDDILLHGFIEWEEPENGDDHFVSSETARNYRI